MRLSLPMLFVFLFAATAVSSFATESVRLDPDFGQVPLSFVLNEGQFDPALKFVAEGNNENTYAEHHTPITTVLVLDTPYRQAAKPALEESSLPKPAQDTNQVPIFIHFYKPNFSFAVIGEAPISGTATISSGTTPPSGKPTFPITGASTCTIFIPA
jgi:hypothetical protein